MNWEPVIGLEVHVQLNTASKIFSDAPTRFGSEPNTQASLIDLGMPGVLPVLNEKVVHMAIKFGIATHAHISNTSVFARKNYFYPDLPKGYQISQYEKPIIEHGYLTITHDQQSKKIGITRAHLEEDAGKSMHDTLDRYSAIDLNRAGIPLLEIVSDPVMHSSGEAIAYLKVLHNLVRYLDICDGNMQEGSFRVDANVSVRPQGEKAFGTRCEIKNLNSFKFVEKAILFEIDRQISVIESGQKVVQETRLYDSTKDETRSLRQKEDANDYRYFPDPDLLPLIIHEELIEKIKSTMPELPDEKMKRFKENYQLSDYDANLLSQDKSLSIYFEDTLKASHSSLPAKLVANWIQSELLAFLNKSNLTIDNCPIKPLQLSELLQRITDETISGKIAKQVFETMWQSGESADTIIEKHGLKQVTDVSFIETCIEQTLKQFPEQVKAYQAGQTKIFGFFVGQIMKASAGKANPQQINTLLSQKLSKT